MYIVKCFLISLVDFASGTTDSNKSHVSTPDYLERRQKVRRKSGNIIAGIPGIPSDRFFNIILK